MHVLLKSERNTREKMMGMALLVGGIKSEIKSLGTAADTARCMTQVMVTGCTG